MKKIALAALAVFVLGLAPVAAAVEDNPDRQAVKKAVRDNPHFQKGMEARWFKILVTDLESGKEKVKITLPLSLVEIFLNAHKGRHLRVDMDEYDLDLKELFRELKAIGPMALIEVSEDDERIKIWLE